MKNTKIEVIQQLVSIITEEMANVKMDGTSFEEMVTLYDSVRESLAPIEEAIKPIQELEGRVKDALKSKMSTENQTDLAVGCRKLKLSTVSTTRFDSKTFQTAHPRLFKKFSSTSETKRFSIR